MALTQFHSRHQPNWQIPGCPSWWNTVHEGAGDLSLPLILLSPPHIASIRPYLSDEGTAQLVSPLILSRLDYCNSTLSGLLLCLLNWLQKVQNNAARLVLCKRKSDHVTRLLEKLHWLPVEARIHYKIATLAFRHFENSLPPYLWELFHTYQPSRTLRSSSEKLLKVPKTNLKSAGNKSFHFQAAKIWNSLPTNVCSSPSLSSFKKNLKTSF